MKKYMKLSKRYPHFVYHSFDYQIIDDKLEGAFLYQIKNESEVVAFEFRTSYTIAFVGDRPLSDTNIDTLLFHLGLVEAISYWKLTCAPHLHILCGSLDNNQIQWWKKLFKKGLSEFFYVNEIQDWDESQLSIHTSGKNYNQLPSRKYNPTEVIVPIGGGKDSITSVESIGDVKQIIPLAMNPIEASKKYIAHKNLNEYILIRRKLDPQIIELNSQGFLNGHIPFSAVLSMYAMTAARIFGIQDIALSNESSANEPTILGTDINHQYSKSLEYEQDIRAYTKKHIEQDINYFSLLRPLNEYQITRLFSTADAETLQIFRSCNVGSKKGIWCTNCPKCLFTYIMLHAHLSLERMIEIFGEDLLNKSELKDYFLSLTGQRTEKPFECVGTIEEVNAALLEIKQKRATLPLLLDYWDETLVEKTGAELLTEFQPHELAPTYANIIKNRLRDVTKT